jgi:hypothetical protein
MFRTSFAAAAVAAISSLLLVATGVRVASAAEIRFLCAGAYGR